MGNKTYKIDYFGDKIKELLNKIDILSKKDIGLENVDNTSDVNKPVSILQKQEIKKAADEVLVEAKKYTDNELATFDFIKIIDALPTRGLPNRIYLVPKTNTTEKDLFDEYLWINNQWEWITTKQIEVDLSTVEPKHFIINADYDITTNTILNADKTYEEVLSAYNNGNTPKLCLRAEELIDSMPRVYTFELLFVGSMSVDTLGVMIFTNAYSILGEYNGNLIEAMFSIDNTWQIKLQSIDETPTENSSNAITSGGVYNALLKYIPWWESGKRYNYGDLVIYYGADEREVLIYRCEIPDNLPNESVNLTRSPIGNDPDWIMVSYQLAACATYASTAYSDSDYNCISETYSRRPITVDVTDQTLTLEASACDNHIFQANILTSLTFGLYSGSFSPDYTCSINFTSGNTPTRIKYTNAGVINWVGTDCYLDEDYSYMDDGSWADPLSIFSPVANKRYNIAIYFDGQTFVACVNGFVQQTMDNILGG